MRRKYINFVIGSLQCYVVAFTYRGIHILEPPIFQTNNSNFDFPGIRSKATLHPQSVFFSSLQNRRSC